VLSQSLDHPKWFATLCPHAAVQDTKSETLADRTIQTLRHHKENLTRRALLAEWPESALEWLEGLVLISGRSANLWAVNRTINRDGCSKPRDGCSTATTRHVDNVNVFQVARLAVTAC
jgi:hypothetical protein